MTDRQLSPATLAHSPHDIFRRLEHEQVSNPGEEVFATLQEPWQTHAQHPPHVLFTRTRAHERCSHIAHVMTLAVQHPGEMACQQVITGAIRVHAVDVPDALVVCEVNFSHVEALCAEQL